MRINVIAFLVGVLFALGLGMGEMTNPQRIIGFLNVLGDWDPMLVFVMAGAVLSHVGFYQWAKRRPTPLISQHFHWPTQRDIDKRLLCGAALFGIGWGLVGYCPGPALTAVATLHPSVIAFAAAMLVGMKGASHLNQ